MADKSFGVKDINLIGASGTPEIESPNNLNIKAVNVAISTDMSVGGELTVADKIIHTGDTNTSLRFPANDTVTVETAGTERVRVTSDGKIGINVITPQTTFHSSGTTNGQQATFGISSSGLKISTFQKTDNDAGVILDAQQSSNGTLTFATSGTERLRIDSSGRIGINASTFNDAGEALRVQAPSGQNNTHLTIKANSTSGYSVLNFGDDDFNEGRIKYDHSDNSMAIFTNDAERLRVNADGSSTFENFIAVNQTGSTEACFHGRLSGTNTSVIRANGSAMFASYNDSSASGFGVDINVNANAGDVRTQCQSTASQYTQMYGAYYGSTRTFHVLASGNVQNTNNSYGQISDVKLKENIVDANSQWNDVKSVQVRNFNFKSETGISTHTQIGVVAQEIESVSPGIVYETPDLNDEGEDLGTVTKSVSYSVLYMKSVKALQEAMTRIETLEAKVAALEG